MSRLAGGFWIDDIALYGFEDIELAGFARSSCGADVAENLLLSSDHQNLSYPYIEHSIPVLVGIEITNSAGFGIHYPSLR